MSVTGGEKDEGGGGDCSRQKVKVVSEWCQTAMGWYGLMRKRSEFIGEALRMVIHARRNDPLLSLWMRPLYGQFL